MQQLSVACSMEWSILEKVSISTCLAVYTFIVCAGDCLGALLTKCVPGIHQYAVFDWIIKPQGYYFWTDLCISSEYKLHITKFDGASENWCGGKCRSSTKFVHQD